MIHSCKSSGCGKLARVRGCCRRCYGRYFLAVKAGETTWAALEAAGQVDSPKEKAWKRSYLKQEEIKS